MATMVEKWFYKIYSGDLFIGLAQFKETPKQFRYTAYPSGEGRNVIVGFNGAKESTQWLLDYHTIFEKDDKRLCDSYEEAHAKLSALIDTKVAAAQRQVDAHLKLRKLFDSVVYTKQ